MKSKIAVTSRIGVALLLVLTVATGAMTLVSVRSNATAERTRTARDYAISLITSEKQSATSVVREKTLADLLPNHRFRIGSARPQALDAGIVVGTVAAAREGISQSSDNVSGDQRRTIILTVDVEYGVGEISGAKQVELDFPLGPEADSARALAGFADLGEIFAVVNLRGSTGVDPVTYTVRQSGGLLGVMDAEHVISFPGLGSKSTAFLDGLDTVNEVLAEAARSDVVTEVKRAGASTEQE